MVIKTPVSFYLAATQAPLQITPRCIFTYSRLVLQWEGRVKKVCSLSLLVIVFGITQSYYFNLARPKLDSKRLINATYWLQCAQLTSILVFLKKVGRKNI